LSAGIEAQLTQLGYPQPFGNRERFPGVLLALWVVLFALESGRLVTLWREHTSVMAPAVRAPAPPPPATSPSPAQPAAPGQPAGRPGTSP